MYMIADSFSLLGNNIFSDTRHEAIIPRKIGANIEVLNF